MDTNTLQKERDKITQISTPQEAQTQLTVLPARMIYDARYALQNAIIEGVSFEQLLPLAIAVGWTEGLIFAWDKQTQVEAVHKFQQQAHNGGTSSK